MKLNVIDHHPAAWFLLRAEPGEDDGWYLDVNCGESAVGFSLLVRLSAAEYAEYHALGRVFIDDLAARIAYGWRDYAERDLGKMLGAEVSAAVARFRCPPAGSDENNPSSPERD